MLKREAKSKKLQQFGVKHAFKIIVIIQTFALVLVGCVSKKLILSSFYSPPTLRQGYTPELLKILNESSQYTGDYQMKFLLEEMLNRKEVSAADVLSRVNFVITGLLYPQKFAFCYSTALLFPRRTTFMRKKNFVANPHADIVYNLFGETFWKQGEKRGES